MHSTIWLDYEPLRDRRAAETPAFAQNGHRPFLERERLTVTRLAKRLSVLAAAMRAPTHPRACEERDKAAEPPLALPATTLEVSAKISTYSELQAHVHRALRIQHPEWVQPNGESSLCDAYEARLAELLHRFTHSTTP